MPTTRLSQQDFRAWRLAFRDRAHRQARLAAPEAYYIRGVGWCGPGWEKAQTAYCDSLMGRDKSDA